MPTHDPWINDNMDQLAASHWDPGTQKQTKQDSASAVNLNVGNRVELANVEGDQTCFKYEKTGGRKWSKMSQGLNLVGKIGKIISKYWITHIFFHGSNW